MSKITVNNDNNNNNNNNNNTYNNSIVDNSVKINIDSSENRTYNDSINNNIFLNNYSFYGYKKNAYIRTIVSFVVTCLTSLEKVCEIPLEIIQEYIPIILIISFVVFAYNILQLLRIHELNENGKFIEIRTIASLISDIKDHDVRYAGRLFKNENNEIFEISGCSCSICKSPPIGRMLFMYDKSNREYFLECMENPNHRIYGFDYKDKFIM